MEYGLIDQSDYIESAAYFADKSGLSGGKPCSQKPCVSCGGGCYGCKGSEGASASLEKRESKLKEMVENVLS
jgi:hypothetical protein